MNKESSTPPFRGKLGRVRLVCFLLSFVSALYIIIRSIDLPTFDNFHAENAFPFIVGCISLLVWIALSYYEQRKRT